MPENVYLKAFDFAKTYVSLKFRPFCSEDIRIKFDAAHPKNSFSDWGTVMRQLKKDGLILENGFTRSTLPRANGRLVIEWISKAYSDRQRQNRELEATRQHRECQNDLFTNT